MSSSLSVLLFSMLCHVVLATNKTGNNFLTEAGVGAFSLLTLSMIRFALGHACDFFSNASLIVIEPSILALTTSKYINAGVVAT